MEWTTSSVILFQFIVAICEGINPTNILNLGGSYDKILSGHSYELLKVKTLEHCHNICLYSPKCLSVNWNTKTKYCQLNSEDIGSGAPLTMSTGNVYVPAPSSNIMNHVCRQSPCKFGEVCVPVTSAADFVCLLPHEQVSATTLSPTTTTPTTTSTTTTTTMTTTLTTTTTATSTSTTMTTTTTTATSTTTRGGVEISTSYDHLQLLPLPYTSWVQIKSVDRCLVVESILPAASGTTVEDFSVDYDVDVPVYRSDPKGFRLGLDPGILRARGGY
ncbi:uncharacterized protein [Haliotis asinina]|uniref:uncharacterized protein n=1 Tax=Haliotis asinina TaxID=109174 RepID=UPI0035319BE6